MAEREVEVFVQIGGKDVLAGRLWAHRRGSTESQTFSYTADYLSLPSSYALDPALPLTGGQHQTPLGRAIFGAFSDCAPDRWGRRLIARAERARAKKDDQAPRSHGEIDYLLGVRDDLRQGALRFREPGSEAFLAIEDAGVPALLELPKLLNAAERLERDEASEAELAALLRGGSSLGGARPKAHVLDQDGRIAIAKFPSPTSDDWDVMRWEALSLDLARAAGINVPDSKLHVIDGKSVLVLDRFDRVGERRVAYASAMTMLERADGDHGSYTEIADVISQHSPQVSEDLLELWRRIVFSILISNFDDHLRNHGFLRRSSSGWSLSPAFDLNPDPGPGERHLNTAIDLGITEARIDRVLEVAPYFGLSDEQAKAVLGEVSDATRRWRQAADRLKIAASEIELMRPAFEHVEADRAQSLTRP
jgi:serine/threonine-protein kinase HipA